MAENNYKDFLKALIESKDSRTFLNSDEEHALDVLVQIFQNAQSIVRIFAGCLCEHVGNQQSYIVALSEFIERNGEVRILLNAYDENKVKESGLFKRIAYYKSVGKNITLKITSAKPYISGDVGKKEVHFTIGDNKMYRFETDINKRTAECNFNNQIIAENLSSVYDRLFANSKEIDIVNLFTHATV